MTLDVYRGRKITIQQQQQQGIMYVLGFQNYDSHASDQQLSRHVEENIYYPLNAISRPIHLIVWIVSFLIKGCLILILIK